MGKSWKGFEPWDVGLRVVKVPLGLYRGGARVQEKDDMTSAGTVAGGGEDGL